MSHFTILTKFKLPLYKLLNKNTKWTWTQNQMEAFTKSKELLLPSNLLEHYNPDLPLVLCSDASPVEISSVLSHIMPDISEKPIAYASRIYINFSRKKLLID